MIGRLGTLIVLCGQLSIAEGADLSRAELPVKHTLFEYWQGDFAAAYEVAEGYKLAGEVTVELKLTQASASFELGFVYHGRDLVNAVDVNALLPENQSRLHMYLARDAYRRRDWPFVAQHLNEAGNSEDPYRVYLSAEVARSEQRFEDAAALLRQLPNNETLRFYGLFNLAADNQSIPTLEQLIELPIVDFEQQMIHERAVISLADLYVSIGQTDKAKLLLAEISIDHSFGPVALARLASLYAQADDQKTASTIWYYLQEQHPWHRATAEAYSGLGYALLKTKGEEAAYGSYLSSLEKIENQKERISAFSESLHKNDLDIQQIAEKLVTGLGHDDWVAWLADDETQTAFSEWRALNIAAAQLSNRRDDLNSLSRIDRERQRRILIGLETLQDQQLQTTRQQLDRALQAELRSLQTDLRYGDPQLQAFATKTELALFAELDALSKRASAKEQQDRIQRLQGALKFQVYDDLAVRKQTRRRALERSIHLSDAAETRIERIIAAASELEELGGLGSRIAALDVRVVSLQAATEKALGDASETLLAAVKDQVSQDEALLVAQSNAIQYNIVKLLDNKLIAGATP